MFCSRYAAVLWVINLVNMVNLDPGVPVHLVFLVRLVRLVHLEPGPRSMWSPRTRGLRLTRLT